eukprot:2289243-Alexandrium_andersonii.AAC.1
MRHVSRGAAQHERRRRFQHVDACVDKDRPAGRCQDARWDTWEAGDDRRTETRTLTPRQIDGETDIFGG